MGLFLFSLLIFMGYFPVPPLAGAADDAGVDAAGAAVDAAGAGFT